MTQLASAGHGDRTRSGAQGRTGFRWRWVTRVTAGEVLGFVVATALAAATAYAVAMVSVVLGDRVASLPVPLQVVGGAALGAVLLSTIGTAQWLVLRRAVPGSVFWIPATAAAWAVGLGAFLAVSTPLWQPGRSFALTVAIGVLAALVMAVTVALLTLSAALRLTAGATEEYR